VDRIIDIASDGRHLSRERGFLLVTEDGREIGRIALDEIAGVIVHAHGTTCSTSLLAELAERGAPVVFCGPNHAPRSVLMPLEGHHAQGGRLRAQWQAKVPLIKQAWRQIVQSKIAMQAAALDAVGEAPAPLTMLRRKVASGDPANIEAQAARYYWPMMMGETFRRDRDAPDINGLLNYGYTVLRATAARAVVAAGLHPSIGLHHANRGNAFALADDLMEPFRPLVDCTARTIAAHHGPRVDTEAKKAMARLIALDLPLGDGLTPVSVALTRLATSLGQSFETGQLALAFAPAARRPHARGAGRMSGPPTFLSGYRIMWILVMFDLPTDTKRQRKAATGFRNFLLDEGFERSQFSVYARFVNGKEAFQTRVNRIERHLPAQGDIQILTFTDRQYRDIVHFSDQGRRRPRENPEQLALF